VPDTALRLCVQRPGHHKHRSNRKEPIMAIASLKDLYIDQLQDIYSANKQSHAMTRKLADAATNSDLVDALKAGVDGIADGKDIAAQIVRSHGEDPTEEHCKGMEGLVKEAQAHAIDADISDDDVRDAMIITQYQRMTHYGIAGWGCVLAFAKRLGLEEDAEQIQKCLDNTYDGDRHMTEIATGGVNEAALD
jgi:ferritin-like metal-binding protein YciE